MEENRRKPCLGCALRYVCMERDRARCSSFIPDTEEHRQRIFEGQKGPSNEPIERKGKRDAERNHLCRLDDGAPVLLPDEEPGEGKEAEADPG